VVTRLIVGALRNAVAVNETPDRPAASAQLAAGEFLRWYWLKSELVALARELGVSTGGSKRQLTDRIAQRLATGPSATAADTRQSRSRSQGSGRSAAPLPEPLTTHTVVPAGQPCSQQLRTWFRGEIGPHFTFDAHMRQFFAAADGTTTLDDAVRFWHTTRGQRPAKIAPQFEFNQFTRDWRIAHPEGERSELLTAWATYRNTHPTPAHRSRRTSPDPGHPTPISGADRRSPSVTRSVHRELARRDP